MKKVILMLGLSLGILSLTSCGTIFGGSRYNAHIITNDADVQIYYKDQFRGMGRASFKVNRKDADKFTFTLKKGDKSQDFSYHSRDFRGWAFVGSLLGWSSFYFIPTGVIVDLATGALWKPADEPGVYKRNYKNFEYVVSFNGTNTDKNSFKDEIHLKNGSIIYGDIVERMPQQGYKIKTKEGNIFFYKNEEIEKVIEK